MEIQRSHNTHAMDNALAPHDENGLISPMAFQGGTDGCGKPLHYAVVPNDGSPMYFNDDFLPGGKFYGKITYHPGFVERSFGVMDDGKVTPLMPGEVIFTDPRFNAAQLASMVQRDGIPPELKPAFMQLSTLFASNGIHPVPEEKKSLMVSLARAARAPLRSSATLPSRFLAFATFLMAKSRVLRSNCCSWRIRPRSASRKTDFLILLASSVHATRGFISAPTFRMLQRSWKNMSVISSMTH